MTTVSPASALRTNSSPNARSAPPERLLRSGSRGEDVRQMQQRLRDAGYQLKVDGIFGPETQRTVRTFQQENRIKVDGIVGPQTRGALQSPVARPSEPADSGRVAGERRAPTVRALSERPTGTIRASDLQPRTPSTRGARTLPGNVPVTLAPRGATQEQQYQHYERIIRANGGSIRPGERAVLGLRGLDPSGQVHGTTANNQMRDTFAVLWRDQRGNAHVEHFRGSTHPGQARSSLSPDANRDGVGDVGMIREGNFRVTPNGMYHGAWSYHVKTTGGSDRLRGVRDTNHDGQHSSAEWADSARRGDTLGAVLFHPGTSRNTVRSIGCLNVQDWDGFMTALGGRSASFNFSLVNAAGAER